MTTKDFIAKIPKADLHVHLEGTMEPELIFRLAKRNDIALPYPDLSHLKAAYKFDHLADFLSVYYQGTKVIRTSRDFYDITLAYLQRAATENTLHADIFIDPQAHLDKGITLAMMLDGVLPAVEESREKYGISTGLILCFLRHRPLEESIQILQSIGPLQAHFAAVGLAAKELGHPPKDFTRLYEMAGKMGLRRTAHAGEEGPADYVRQAVELLRVDRIDHGNSIVEDPGLMQRVKEAQIPLTLCPLSNLHLQVIEDMKAHPADRLLRAGLKVTINSDDPSYFGGYMNANLLAVSEAFDWGQDQIIQVMRNSFDAAYTSPERKVEMHQILTDFINNI